MKNVSKILMAVGLMMGLTACSSNSEAVSPQTTGTKAQETEVLAESAESTAGQAAADWKPELSTITVRVPNAAGGTSDLCQRVVAQGIQDKFGTSVVVQNITGSSGFLAATDLMAYDPSVCEYMAVTDSLFSVAPLFNPSIQLSLDDFEILNASISEPNVFVVSKSLGVNNWEEFLEYAKANRVVYASSAPGGATHMLAQALFHTAGIENTNAVTDNGGNKNVLAVLSGDAGCVIANAPMVSEYVATGELIPLLTYGEEAYKGFEGLEVPSVLDKGYDIAWNTYTFQLCRKGVDEASLNGMRQAFDEVMKSEKTQQALKDLKVDLQVIPVDEARAGAEETIKKAKTFFDAYYRQ